MWICPKCNREFASEAQQHECNTSPQTIDEYIMMQPEELKPLLMKIRETIRQAAPEAVERMSWRMPTFWQGENLIHFAVFKNHIGIYPGALMDLPFTEQLSGYKTTKGAIQFPLNRPIDYQLIGEITRYRVSVVKEKRKK